MCHFDIFKWICHCLQKWHFEFNVSLWVNMSWFWMCHFERMCHFESDTFIESDRFKSCFFIICQKILISQNAQSVTTFFLKVSLLTNVSLLNVSLLIQSVKKNECVTKKWLIHLIVSLFVTHSLKSDTFKTCTGITFFQWCRFSPIHAEIGRELVRLITVINLNKFLPNTISPKSLKRYSHTTFRWSVATKCSFLVF